VGGTSGALLLDALTRAARQTRATDIYLVSGVQPMQRVAGEILSTGGARIDGDLLSREIGVVAPNDARSRWTEEGAAVFTYGDGLGRVRVTLGRDHRGPSAALRLLPDEPPALETLGLPEVEGWLDRKGLIVVAGMSGSGKTVTLAALVRALGERKRRVVAIEDPIELVHASPWISQRAVGPHVISVAAGVAGAMNEGADAIVVGRVNSEATARGVVEAVAGGHLVLTTVVAPLAAVALDRMLSHLDEHQRELAHGLMFGSLLGAIQPVLGRNGSRTFEIIGRPAADPSK
jgi:twitching motility protein PilT